VRERIREAWERYRRDVIPEGAGEVQLRETRLAFYGGAQALFATLTGGLSDGSEPTETDLAMMSELDQELRQFVEALS
jgi:hypothetical protein